uniref:Uncharacterized protein n=1 Tax=Octopus bimaculoides TaxID=37653 RepID=A0A0L8IG06_OCTBM
MVTFLLNYPTILALKVVLFQIFVILYMLTSKITSTNPLWLANRTIATPTNEAAQFVNDFLLTRIPGELKIYRSSDTVDNETLYPIEFINKLTPSGFPPHILKLYLDATNGHWNGTQYIIVSFHDHVVETEVASGPYAGSTLLFPKIPHVSQEMEFAFTFTCKSFPVKPAFALTCNKTQGQLFEQIGIYLPTHFFSHGQLYVALSRVRNKANVINFGCEKWKKTLITENCVYKEILL